MSSTDIDLTKSDVNMVQAYIDARADVEKLEAQLKRAKERVEKREAQLLDFFVENGYQNVKCGGRTVSLVKRTYARPKPDEPREALLAALRDEGYGDLIKVDVNPSTLAALVREHTAEGDPLPESIAQHIIVTDVFSVSMRKG